MTFFDRIKEIEFLKSMQDRKRKTMVAIFGRRRIGKTALLRKAFPEAFYLFVDTRSSETMLRDFSYQSGDAQYVSWESLFRNVLAKEKTIILDEFQNFLRVDNSVFSIFQKVWDEYSGGSLLIFCGSYAGIMKRIFSDSREPLFGRADYLMELKAFAFEDVHEMLSSFGYSLTDIVQWYAVLGGVPHYLWRIQERKHSDVLLEELFFGPFAPFREEGRNLLVTEFGSEHPGYFAVLKAIGSKDRDASEIVDRTAMERTKAMKYVSELADRYGMIEKVENVLSKSKRGLRYRIADNFLSFWFGEIYSQMEEIEFDPDQALANTINRLPQITGNAFERIMASLINRLCEEQMIPFKPAKIGKHWGKIPGTRDRAYEIDLIGYNQDNVLFVECKWTSKPVDVKIAQAFLERCEYLGSPKKKTYVIVSKSGFKEGIPEEIIKITLRDLDQLLNKQTKQ